MSASADHPQPPTIVVVAAEKMVLTITIEYLRSFEALKDKLDEQLGSILTKLNDQFVETTTNLANVTQNSLKVANFPAWVI
eukprot:scaffold102201_cov35-Attheya_sp.AAC.1